MAAALPARGFHRVRVPPYTDPPLVGAVAVAAGC